MRVIAIARGFDNLCVREIGAEFDMPDDVFEREDKNAVRWFEPVDAKLKVKYARPDPAHPAVPAVEPTRQQLAHDAALQKAHDKEAAAHKRDRE